MNINIEQNGPKNGSTVAANQSPVWHHKVSTISLSCNIKAMFEKRRYSLQRLCLETAHYVIFLEFFSTNDFFKYVFFIILDNAYLDSILVQLTHDD